MDKRKNKNRFNKNNQNFRNNQEFKSPQKSFQFNKTNYENIELEKNREHEIQQIKNRTNVCPICSQPIIDIASCMHDKKTDKPVHFDCALNQVKDSESLGLNEKISYIGQGRFAVVYYENPRDIRHFTIKKIIEWEDREKNVEWRDELSGLYSQIK